MSRGNARSILPCRWTWTSRRRERLPVAFAVNCPAVGAGVTVRTTGPDIDQDGYRVTVDGIDQAPIPSNAVAFIRAEPGSRTITLTGLASNCAFTGPASQTVTIVPNQPAPIEFAVVCTATTGVIEVSLSTSGTDTGGPYQVFVDGVQQSQFHHVIRARGDFRRGDFRLGWGPSSFSYYPLKLLGGGWAADRECDRRRTCPRYGRGEFRRELHSGSSRGRSLGLRSRLRYPTSGGLSEYVEVNGERLFIPCVPEACPDPPSPGASSGASRRRSPRAGTCSARAARTRTS